MVVKSKKEATFHWLSCADVSAHYNFQHFYSGLTKIWFKLTSEYFLLCCSCTWDVRTESCSACELTWSASLSSGSLYSIWVSSRAWNLQQCSECSVGRLTMLQSWRERERRDRSSLFNATVWIHLSFLGNFKQYFLSGDLSTYFEATHTAIN